MSDTAASPRAPETPFARVVSDFCANPIAVFGLALLAVILFLGLFAPLLSPQNPYDLAQLDVMDSRLPPGSKSPGGGIFWLGTDDQGRDMLSAIFYGLRISIGVGVAATVLALVIGLAMGLAAAYLGGRLESLIMRIVDIQLSFPAILIALILIAVLGQGIGKVIAALVTVQWAYYARTVRAAALVEKRKEYMEAARCLALSPARTVFRHLLPNCLPPLIVQATLAMGFALLTMAALSFIGLGIQPPQSEWGVMTAEGANQIVTGEWWLFLFPGMAIMIAVLAFNLVGDGLRDFLDPRMRGIR